MENKKNIAFVTGGYSGEAVISYKSAKTIESHIDKEKYNVYKIDITPDGWWYESAGKKTEIDKNDFTIHNNGRIIKFDAVLIGIHGTPGEDGKLQGYLDLMGLPYTTCDAATSALTFNKRYTVAVAAFAGINVARSIHIFRHSNGYVEEIAEHLKMPVFVKPNNGGSSIGMSKVMQVKDLKPALEKAFKEDAQVLVEELIEGREFTIGLYRSKGKIEALPITEIKAGKEFFDFEAKYTPGLSEEITPAEVSEIVAQKVKEAAKKVYHIFNCRGIVRMDFIYNEAKAQPYLLEINTVPGQTEESIVPKQVRAAGMTLKEFYTILIEECINQ